MAPALSAGLAQRVSRGLGLSAVLITVLAAAYFLFSTPLADVFFAAWVLGTVGIALLGWFAARTNRRAVVWLAAAALLGISILGMWSIGFLVSPAAVCLLGAALVLQLYGPRRKADRKFTGEPPTVQRTALETLVGVGLVVGGGGLVYVGAIETQLFGACARETLDCALAKTRWVGMGQTVLGLLTATAGSVVVWRRVTDTRPRTVDPSDR